MIDLMIRWTINLNMDYIAAVCYKIESNYITGTDTRDASKK